MLRFGIDTNQTTALLVKQVNLKKDLILKNYIYPISKYSTEVPAGADIGAIGLYYPATGNLKKKDLVESASEVLDECDTLGIERIIVTDSKYFYYLAGTKGIEKNAGKAFQCAISGYEHIKVIPMLSHVLLQMYPDRQKTQDLALKRIAAEMNHEEIEDKKFKFDFYKVIRTERELQHLLSKDILAIDIEATGLRFERDELVSIAFAWSDTQAVTLPIHESLWEGTDQERKDKAEEVKGWLKEFFIAYNGVKIFHNYLFDAKFLVRHLFMADPLDHIGRTLGANYLDSEDTMLMAFLSLNSTSRFSLSLKDLAYEYLGDYAVDVKDVLALPKDTLYKYNAMDVVGTFWVYNKYYKLMQEEEQEDTYRIIIQPSLKYLVNMMVAGLPISKTKTKEAKIHVKKLYDAAMDTLQDNFYVKQALTQLRLEAADKYNAKTKVKKKTADDFVDLKFNPNSSAQLRVLLFDILEFEPIDFTDKKQPKTNRDSIIEFLDKVTDPDAKEALENLITISETSIVLSTFLKAFEDLWTDVGQGDIGRLYGNQRLGGTVTGRLSSNSPNFANLPSKGAMGKLIKACFPAPEGYLFWSSDYAALESLSA